MNTLHLENINKQSPYHVAHQMNFLAIISRKDNPKLIQVIAEFDETISFLFDSPEEST